MVCQEDFRLVQVELGSNTQGRHIQMDQYYLHDEDEEECYEHDEKDDDDDCAMMTIPYV